MGIDTKHPDYEALEDDWRLVKDANAGQSRVKNQGFVYLKPTPGMVLDGALRAAEPGKSNYEAYLSRAVFPDFTNGAIETLVGILDAKPPEITLPPGMEYIRNKATFNGEDIIGALRRIHAYQLESGRVGLLVDFPAYVSPTAKPQAYIAIYDGTDIINWDTGSTGTDDTQHDKLNLVVLNESGHVRTNDFSWKDEKRYRVLMLGNGEAGTTDGTYKFGVFGDTTSFSNEAMTEALYKSTPCKEIPFEFINTRDNLPCPDRPPLLPLAEICMTIYRMEADYRQNLYMQGQDTLVVIGSVGNNNLDTGGVKDEAIRTGAGARIDVQVGGDVKYVGVSSNGLSEQREALRADKDLAAVRSGQLLAPGKMSMESGEALKTRVAAQTATLTSIARVSCKGLESVLKKLAVWIGENPDKVKVEPNLDFTNIAIQGQDLVQLVTAKNLGFPLAYKTIHAIAQERGLTKKTFEEELEEIEKDPKTLIERAAELAAGAGGNNPVERTGGPMKSTQGKKQQTNKPTE